MKQFLGIFKSVHLLLVSLKHFFSYKLDGNLLEEKMFKFCCIKIFNATSNDTF